MKKIYQVLGKLSAGVAIISYIGVFFAMMFTVVDILLRTVWNKPMLGAYEIVELTMSCIVFASFAYTQTAKGHVSVVMFLRLMPQKLKFLCYTVTSFLSAAISVLITYGTLRQAGICFAKNYVTANRGIPYGPFYVIAGVGMGLFSLVLIADALFSAAAIFNRACAAEIEADWT